MTRAPDPVDPNTKKEMTALEHLEELRIRLVRMLSAVAIFSVASYFFSEALVEWITRAGKSHVDAFYFFGPTEAFLVRLKVSVFVGFLLASPFVIYQAWMFVAPGLRRDERRVILPSTLISSMLFLLGALFSYLLVIPVALGFLMSYKTDAVQPLIAIDRYLGFVMLMAISFGFIFNLPVMIVGLVKLSVLNAEMLRQHRKGVIVGALVLAAVLTPPDVITQVLLAAPLLLLYEVSIWAAVLVEKMKRS